MLLLNNNIRYILKIGFSFFCFILIGSLFYQLNQEKKEIKVLQEKKEIKVLKNIAERDSFATKSIKVHSQYETGYNTGYVEAIIQFTVENYSTSNINQKCASTNKNEEFIKGYKDGYHKGIESIDAREDRKALRPINCPR
jgi:Na+-transporting NADH:ubiquinone oxidoreductase subunit NqrC